MIISRPESQLVTKIIFSPTGQQFRAVFLVTVADGRARGRLISIEAVTAGKLSGKVSDAHTQDRPAGSAPAVQLCLPCFNKNIVVESIDVSFAPIKSPFVSELEFFTSQPTRAPSFF